MDQIQDALIDLVKEVEYELEDKGLASWDADQAEAFGPLVEFMATLEDAVFHINVLAEYSFDNTPSVIASMALTESKA